MATVKVKFRPSAVSGRPGTVYYQVTHRRLVRQIKVDCGIYENEWSCISRASHSSSLPSERADYLASVGIQISCDLQKFRDIIAWLEQTGKPYTAEEVVGMFRKGEQKHYLFDFMRQTIDHMRQAGKCRTAETYSDTLKSFSAFRKGEDIRLDQITSEMMQLYERHLRAKGLIRNSTSFYMRILRAEYNRAVQKELVKQQFPFRHVYTGIDKTRKRAIPSSDISKIKNLDLSGHPSLEFARDLFLFSFYTRGMAFVDLAFLKKQNLKKGFLIYCRSKTGQLMRVKWEPCMEEILIKHPHENSEYLLPILTEAYDDAGRQKRYRSVQRLVNKNLKTVAKMAGIDENISMYVSRHSWASAAKTNKVPLTVISEGMGHDSETTTLIYLNSLDTSEVDQANLKIINGIK